MATRKTQPYREGARNPGMALQAMTRGKTFGGYNPQDATRRVQLLLKASKQSGGSKGARPARPARPAR